MGYVGGSLTSFFGDQPQAATRLAARDMCARGGDRMVDVARINTPIDKGNLRTSWYQIPTQRTLHDGLPAYESGVATDVEYAPYVENGTGLFGPKHAKYPIRPKTPGGVLRWRNADGSYSHAKEVMHPGSPGQHMVAIAAEVVEFEMEGGLMDDILMEWARAVEASAD